MTRTNDLRQELRHAVFLQRAADLAPTSAEARLGQGAFLALRFVDLLAPGLDVEADAFRYQHAATERYCREISGGSAEAAHLLGLVDSSMAAGQSGDVGHVVPGMLAYAHYLEDAGHYDEALDVLDALARVGGGRLGAADAVALALRVARVNRKLARFDAADAAYGEAGSRAAAAGDVFSRLLSRIGQANTALGRGNLAGAEASYREILADARTARFREAEARTEHGLGSTLQMRGDAGEGLRHIWRAFELYEDESSRMRALNDAAILLLALGHAGAAERALLKVLRHASHADNRHNALIELMHCASFRRDQVGFQRWHGECLTRVPEMTPSILTDFYLKAGIGQARFSRLRQAEELLRKALETARSHDLHEYEFRVERILGGLGDCAALEHCTAAEAPVENEATRCVAASAAALSV